MQYTLTLTEAEANLLVAGLSELPFKTVQPLIQKIFEQCNQQIAKAREEAENAE